MRFKKTLNNGPTFFYLIILISKEYDQDHILNFDETQIFRESTGNITLTNVGYQHVQVQTNGNDKLSYTIGLTYTLTGIKLQQVLVWPTKGFKKQFEGQIPNNKIIFYCSEGSYFNQMLFKKWIQEIKQPYSKSLEEGKKGCIIINNHKTHTKKGLEEELALYNYEIKYLPPNSTSDLQPLNLEQDKNKKLTHTKFLKFISEVWDEINKNHVIKSWDVFTEHVKVEIETDQNEDCFKDTNSNNGDNDKNYEIIEIQEDNIEQM